MDCQIAGGRKSTIHFVNKTGLLQPQEVLILVRRCNSEAAVVADVGQNQIWAALWFNYTRPGRFLNSGGTGTRLRVSCSHGAKMANPDTDVFCHG